MTAILEAPICVEENKHQCERCFIVGSGPSLDDFDLSKIGKEYVFCLNASITLFANSHRHPNAWWVVHDRRAILEIAPKLEDWHRWKIITHNKPWTALKDIGIRGGVNALIYPQHKIIHTRTVAEDAIQIAEYMGFDEAYLVGIDCGVRDNRPYAKALSWKECHFYDPKDPPANGISKSGISMAIAIENLKKELDPRFKVYNTSPICREIFPHADFNEVIARRPSKKI